MLERHARNGEQTEAPSSQEIHSEPVLHVTIIRAAASDSKHSARLGYSALAKTIAELIREEEVWKDYALHELARKGRDP